MKKIMFTGGGSYGHAMPNVYLMDELKKNSKQDELKFFYLGSNGVEKQLVESKVDQYFSIPAVKLVRGKIFTNLKIPFVLINAIIKAKKILKKTKPDLVFSKGGYVSLPVCIASKMLKIPVIAHESDYSFGLANKLILKTCKTMCVNFEHLARNNKKIVFTGPIISNKFENNSTKLKNGQLINRLPVKLNEEFPTILIVGGSLGARRINEMICSIAKDLQNRFNVIHITGKGNKNMRSFGYYNAFEMIDDMNLIYNSVDFVIGRAGAGVTAECFYKKLPMMLIPLETKASRGDQVQNAQYYQSQGVAEVFHEYDISANLLLIEIDKFFKNLQTYKWAYKTKKNVNGKEEIVKMIEQIIK